MASGSSRCVHAVWPLPLQQQPQQLPGHNWRPEAQLTAAVRELGGQVRSSSGYRGGAGQSDWAEEPALALSWLLRYLTLGPKTGTRLLPPQPSRGGAGKTVRRTKQDTSRGKNSPYHHRLPSKIALESVEKVRCKKQRATWSFRSQLSGQSLILILPLAQLPVWFYEGHLSCLSFLSCKMEVIILVVSEFL